MYTNANKCGYVCECYAISYKIHFTKQICISTYMEPIYYDREKGRLSDDWKEGEILSEWSIAYNYFQ